MQRCPKWSIMIKCPLCPVPTINNLWKQIQNSKLLNKTIYQSKQSMIFFFVGDFWFGLFQVLTLDVFHYRKIRKLLDLVFIFICRTLKKKEGYFTADQLFRWDQELPFSIYICILVLISYMLKMWPLRKFQQWKPSDFLYCWSL